MKAASYIGGVVLALAWVTEEPWVTLIIATLVFAILLTEETTP